MFQFFSALPGYFGGKRRLAPLLFASLANHLPQADWRGLTFVDPFLGGGSVSLLAKAYGFTVTCNDVAYRSTVIGHALIANSSVTLCEADLAFLFQEPREEYAHVAEEQFSPSIFSLDQARFIDRALAGASSGDLPAEKRHLLRLLIVKWALRCQPMSQLRGTDARAAAGGDFDKVSPRRVRHYINSVRLLRPSAVTAMARQLNAAVFPGRGSVSQLDVHEFLPRAQGDVVYFDPPYPGTISYEKEYRALDILMEGRELPVSRFSLDPGALAAMFAAAEHVPVWIVSLNNARLSLEQLLDLIRPHRPTTQAIEVAYRHLGSIATEVKNDRNKEFIVLATK